MSKSIYLNIKMSYPNKFLKDICLKAKGRNLALETIFKH